MQQLGSMGFSEIRQVLPIEFVKAVRKICDEKGILLIADEVQSGFGRTGKLFASEYWKENGCAPDIIATAKSIAGGVPLSAVIASKEAPALTSRA